MRYIFNFIRQSKANSDKVSLSNAILKTVSLDKSGQIVIEYVLILVVTVAVAAILVKGLASRNQDEPGILTAKIHKMLQFVGDDLPDKGKPTPGP